MMLNESHTTTAYQLLSSIIPIHNTTMIFYAPALTAIVAVASSSYGSVEPSCGLPNLHDGRDCRTTTMDKITARGYVAFAATAGDKTCGRASFKLHEKAVSSNEYEEVLAKYPSRKYFAATGAAKDNSIRSFAYSPALQSKRIRA
mmetsp:Transcript_16190/g.25082  ORF Transcript_16190/g.25082 Transcript_16190/m.25082 type:complete len:145 (+) Transcript_16190:12-446(+)